MRRRHARARSLRSLLSRRRALGRLVEAWAEARGVELESYGSCTLRSAAHERGVEPDECYVVGAARKDTPDLAIEVVWTSGGIDKLEIYRALGVPEVWIWEAGAITVYRSFGDRYVAGDTSAVLPGLDVARLARCATITPTSLAKRTFLAQE